MQYVRLSPLSAHVPLYDCFRYGNAFDTISKYWKSCCIIVFLLYPSYLLQLFPASCRSSVRIAQVYIYIILTLQEGKRRDGQCTRMIGSFPNHRGGREKFINRQRSILHCLILTAIPLSDQLELTQVPEEAGLPVISLTAWRPGAPSTTGNLGPNSEFSQTTACDLLAGQSASTGFSFHFFTVTHHEP